MKKKTLLVVSLATLGLVFGAVATVSNRFVTPSNLANADSTKTLVLNADNSPLTTDYQPKVAKSYNWAAINYFLAKKADGAHCVLAPHGSVSNYSSDSAINLGKITGISSIKVKFSGGDLYLEQGITPNGKEYSNKWKITSDALCGFSGDNYFKLSAGDQEVTIDSITVYYSCEENTKLNFSSIISGTKWTGKDAAGVIWEARKTSSGFELKTLNKKVNDIYSATPSFEGNELTLSINSGAAVYKGTLGSDFEKITFKSKSGAAAALVPEVDLYRVYNVENFESYSSTGKGYDSASASNTLYSMSGLRSAFHSDYYATGGKSVFFNDANWKIMGSTDYLTYTADKGHNGSKAAIFKTTTNSMRYVSFSALEPGSQFIGKGSYFSFWAKGGYTGATSSTQSSNSTTLKVRVFYKDGITKCDDSTGDAVEVTIPAGSDWKQYIIPINSSREYYGYSFFSKTATSYVPIDDIQIFTENPNAVYEEPAPVVENYKKTFAGLGSATTTSAVSSVLGEKLNLFFELGSNGYSKAYFNGEDLKVSNYDADAEGNFTLDANYSKELPGLGTVTVTKVAGKFVGNTVTNLTFTGTGLNTIVADNGSISLKEADTVINCDQDTTTAQGMLARWYNDGSWKKDTGNSDRIVADSENKIEGTGSLKVRGYSGNYRLTLANDLPSPIHYKGLGFWVRNNTGKTLTTKFFYYKSAGLTNYVQPGADITVPSNGEWVLVQCGFDADIYNISLFFSLGSSGTSSDKINVDYIHLYK